jgi:Flp pilus assembly protein TadG
MRRLLARLAGNRAGASALEVAVIIPVVGGLVMVAMDFSNAWLMRLQLEQAAQRGIELVAARKGVATSYSYALTEMTNAWGKSYTSATVDAWLECGGTRQQSSTADCGSQQRARYVKLRIAATFTPVFGWGKFYGGPAAGGGATLVGDAVVRVQ